MVVRERLDAEFVWTPDATPVPAGHPPQEPLSRDGAVRLALAHNPDSQRLAGQLGVARAEWLAAARWPNPVVALATRVPLGAPSGLDIEFSVLGRLLDLLMRPERMQASALGFEAAALAAGAAVLGLAAEVDAAYLELVGARHKQAVLEAVAEAAATGATVARRQSDAGLLATLPLAQQESIAAHARGTALEAAHAVDAANVKLARLVGSADGARPLPVPARLAPLPAEPSVPDRPADIAVAERLEIAHARKALEQRAALHAIALDWRWWSLLEVGAGGQRESDRQLSVGPSVEVAVPLFDRGAAGAATTAAALHRAQLELASRLLDVRSEAVAAAQTLRARHAAARHVETVLLPLQSRIAALTGQAHALAEVGTLELLLARRELLAATAAHSDALRDYWLAEARLRQALGGRPLAAHRAPAADD